MAEAIVGPADEAGDVARGDADGPEHDGERGGEELAVAPVGLEEEVVHGLRRAAGGGREVVAVRLLQDPR